MEPYKELGSHGIMAKELSQTDQQIEHIEILNKIVNEYILKGIADPAKIAKGMKMTRAEAMVYIDEWKQVAASNYEIQARSRELLTELDLGYNKAINEYWAIIEDSETPIHVKNSAIKNYTDAMATRHDILQKAGLYDDMEGMAELRETQEKVDKIRALLQEVAVKYPITKQFLLEELSKIFNEPVSAGVVKVDVTEGTDV